MSSEREGKPESRQKNYKQIKRQRKLDARLHKKMDKRHKRKLQEREKEKKKRKNSKKYRERVAPKSKPKVSELTPELMARREKKRKHTKKKLLLIAMILLLVVVACSIYYFAQNIFVKSIEVQGESRYSNEELIEASGIKTGDRLAYTPFFSSKKQILQKFPYLKNVSVGIGVPSKIVIKIKLEEIDYYAYYYGSFYVVAKSGKILGLKDSYSDGFSPKVVVASINKPKIGEKIDYIVEADDKIRLDIFEELEYNKMAENTNVLNMLNTVDMEVYYNDEYKIHIGSIIDLKIKIKMASEAISQYLAGQTGIMDVRVYDTATFKPSKKVSFDYSAAMLPMPNNEIAE